MTIAYDDSSCDMSGDMHFIWGLLAHGFGEGKADGEGEGKGEGEGEGE
eukprot:CAMPEP_0197624620 /NCGR_PEP_ID=MMETSP1338-20131121/4190_1 /TAXON_ID=43686 ORGANISM="Pelagodinium beii, Strain RCC1491" /NCGR_SAMPLE_ID=MMETSP1338 /ASSEMBLY_ACC=CAM_ASM_000754 /LENGTH=47 /DNA_ID= /DNA_START= /DNA_END= /DNA_ORIENTATION=